MSDSVVFLTARLQSTVDAISSLAPGVQQVRYLMPSGYRAERSPDGVHRPVEDVTVALHERGVSREVANAVKHLRTAISAASEAAVALDQALCNWEENSSRVDI